MSSQAKLTQEVEELKAKSVAREVIKSRNVANEHDEPMSIVT